MKQIFSIATAFFLILGSTTSGFAQKGKSPSSSAALSVTRITVRPVPSGLPNGRPNAEANFEIVWKSRTPPQGVFYKKGKTEWLDVKSTSPVKRSFGGGPNDFMLMYMNLPYSDYKPGTHATLTSEQHSHDEMPAAVRNMPGDALYYQLVNSSKWYYVKVNVPKIPAPKSK